MEQRGRRNKINILGIPVDAVTMAEAVAAAAAFIDSGGPHMVVTPNAEIIYLAQRDGELREILCRADLLVPDGFGLVWASRYLGHPLPERVAGIDLMHNLLRLAQERRLRVFLLGARPDVNDLAAARVRDLYPGADLVGAQHGYFPPAEAGAIAARIKELRPHLLLVGMGAPRQERWMARYCREMGVPLCLGVGGSFDVLAGKLARAPLWMQKAGLEWLYRLRQEPKRIRRMLALPRFVIAVAARRGRSEEAGSNHG